MVLVTGATGILGRVVVLELLKRGKTVRATKRKGSDIDEVKRSLKFYDDNAEALFNKIEWVSIDFEDLFSIENALNGISEVYHCAAKVSFNPKDSAELYKTNVEATKRLLYSCQDINVQKFCYISSIAVLDDVNESGEVDESCDFNSKLNHSDYAISKHFAEMEVWRASAEGINTVIVNPGIIIGSGNWHSSSGTMFRTVEKNKYTFSGGTSYVDVRDVAKICIELMDRNIFGERFVLVAGGSPFAEVGNRIRRQLGLKDAQILSEPVLKIGRVANTLLGWLIPPLRMATKSNIEAVTSYQPISNQKIVDRIGYKFIPIGDSIDFHLKNYIADTKDSNF